VTGWWRDAGLRRWAAIKHGMGGVAKRRAAWAFSMAPSAFYYLI